jgi:hypothetical protein
VSSDVPGLAEHLAKLDFTAEDVARVRDEMRREDEEKRRRVFGEQDPTPYLDTDTDS